MKKWRYVGFFFLWDRAEIRRSDDKGNGKSHIYWLDLNDWGRMKHRLNRFEYILHLDLWTKAIVMKEKKQQDEAEKIGAEMLTQYFKEEE